MVYVGPPPSSGNSSVSSINVTMGTGSLIQLWPSLTCVKTTAAPSTLNCSSSIFGVVQINVGVGAGLSVGVVGIRVNGGTTIEAVPYTLGNTIFSSSTVGGILSLLSSGRLTTILNVSMTFQDSHMDDVAAASMVLAVPNPPQGSTMLIIGTVYVLLQFSVLLTRFPWVSLSSVFTELSSPQTTNYGGVAVSYLLVECKGSQIDGNSTLVVLPRGASWTGLDTLLMISFATGSYDMDSLITDGENPNWDPSATSLSLAQPNPGRAQTVVMRLGSVYLSGALVMSLPSYIVESLRMLDSSIIFELPNATSLGLVIGYVQDARWTGVNISTPSPNSPPLCYLPDSLLFPLAATWTVLTVTHCRFNGLQTLLSNDGLLCHDQNMTSNSSSAWSYNNTIVIGCHVFWEGARFSPRGIAPEIAACSSGTTLNNTCLLSHSSSGTSDITSSNTGSALVTRTVTVQLDSTLSNPITVSQISSATSSAEITQSVRATPTASNVVLPRSVVTGIATASFQASAVATSAVALASVFAGAAAVDGGALAALGMMACSSPGMKKSTGPLMYLLSPFADFGPAVMVLGNAGIALCVCVIQVLVLCVVVARGADHETASSKARFPHLAYVGATLMQQGIVRGWVAVVGGDTWHAIDVASVLIGPIFTTTVCFAWWRGMKWAMTNAHFERPKERVPSWPQWAIRLLLPLGDWEPAESRRRFGPVFQNMRGRSEVWINGAILVHGAVFVAVSAVDATTGGNTGCAAQYFTLALLAGGMLAVVGWRRPFKTEVVNMLTVVNYSCVTAITVMLGIDALHPLPSAPSVTSGIAIAQSVSMLVKSVHNIAMRVVDAVASGAIDTALGKAHSAIQRRSTKVMSLSLSSFFGVFATAFSMTAPSSAAAVERHKVEHDGVVMERPFVRTATLRKPMDIAQRTQGACDLLQSVQAANTIRLVNAMMGVAWRRAHGQFAMPPKECLQKMINTVCSEKRNALKVKEMQCLSSIGKSSNNVAAVRSLH